MVRSTILRATHGCSIICVKPLARILSIDYGRKRTGLAVTDPLQIIAGGLATVSTSELFDWLQSYLQREQVERMVLAHQAMLDGGLRKKARQDKALVDEISATIILEDYLRSKKSKL